MRWIILSWVAYNVTPRYLTLLKVLIFWPLWPLILIESQPTEIAKNENEIFFLFRFLRAWSGYVLKFSISPKPLITWSWWNPRFNQKSHFTFRVFLKCTPQTDFFYILWWKFQIKIIHDIINYVHTHVILCLLVVFSIQKNIRL